MAQALALARRGAGKVSPNPQVGCVLVRDGQVVGEGHHGRFGGPHAEVVALRDAGAHAKGATAYVTLEPCAVPFAGKKTPPCTDALIRAGVARVVIATRDPHPQVDGRGVELLRAAGIEVGEGLLAVEGGQLIRGFARWIRTRRPYVIVKAARTRDNHVAARLAGDGWFTSGQSRAWVHRLRAEVDGVLVGRGTAVRDNPALTVREVRGVNPRRIVLDSRLRLPADLRIFRDGAATTLVMTARGETSTTPWGRQIRVSAAPEGVNLLQVLDRLGELGLTALLVEGGPTVHGAFLRAGLVDELVLFTASRDAEEAVQQQPELRNQVSVPHDWTTVMEANLDGDHLIVAQRGGLPA